MDDIELALRFDPLTGVWQLMEGDESGEEN
jgi:hypothetical protein